MPITLVDLRRGMNERHPATLPEGFVEQAWNITYDRSQLGARRNGSDFVVNPISGTVAARAFAVHTPDSTIANQRLWIFGTDAAFRFYTSAWAATTPSVSPADTFDQATKTVSMQSLHGKLFIGCKSNQSRLHVYDGTNIRRVGIAPAAAAPTGADTGVGTYSGTRYFRARFTKESGGVVLVRSEPSPVLTHAPSGAGTGVIVTRPTAPGDSETHWELEESIDNANFYKINGSIILATVTSTSSTAYASVASSGTLSADTGDYTVPPSARFIVIDRDRVTMFGNHEDATRDADMLWTVVGTDTTGVGNDERVPTDTVNRLSLDGVAGGRLTGAIAYETQILAFKQKRVYLISHTGNRASAYRQDPIATTFGAIEGSICEGVDAEGRPSVYFLDDVLGPMRYAAGGFTQLAPQIQRTFGTYLLTAPASVSNPTTNAIFNAKRREVWFHLAQVGQTAIADWPTLRLVYNVETGGVSWHFLGAFTNRLSASPVYASGVWNNVPYISVDNGSGGAAIVEADKDGTSSDYGSRTFRAYIRTKAMSVDGVALNKRLQIMGAVLGARPLTGVSLTISAIRDYGKEVISTTALLTPNAATNPSAVDETFVTVSIDDLLLGEATVVQFEMGDATVRAVAPWSMEQFTATWKPHGVNVEGA